MSLLAVVEHYKARQAMSRYSFFLLPFQALHSQANHLPDDHTLGTVHSAMSKKKKSSSSSGRPSSGGSAGSKKSSRKSAKSSKTSQVSSKKSIGIGRRPTSLSSVASHYNVALGGRYGQSRPGAIGAETAKLLKMTGNLVKYSEQIYDTVQLFLICPTHKKLALSFVADRGLYLPIHAIKGNETWMTSVANLMRKMQPLDSKSSQIASITTEPVLIDVLRLQLPIYLEFVTRVTYYLELTPEACKAKHCNDGDSFAWYSMEPKSLEALESKNSKLLGPEPQMFSAFKAGLQCRELTILDALPNASNEDLLREVNVNDDDILRIYGDFLQHVYPSEYMTMASFKSYLKTAKLVITSNHDALFRAFAINKRTYINFHEFILGLATVSCLSGTHKPVTNSQSAELNVSAPSNPAAVAKFKADFLFRYFAAADADSLSEKELEKAANECPIVKSDMPKLKSLQKSGHISKSSFTHKLEKSLAVAKPSTCGIVEKAAVSPIAQLRICPVYPAIHRRQKPSHKDRAIEAKMAMRFLCENCSSKQYTLALYMMKLGLDGQLYAPTLTKQKDSARMSKTRRERSEMFFSRTFICNKVMDMIHKFAINLKIFQSCKVKLSDVPDWSDVEVRLKNLDKITKICQQAAAHFSQGPRVIKVNSPCFVIGDIHGNLRDLLIYEQSIWPTGIYFTTASILFLGDYVDRGSYSVECILYLLCLKCMAPERVHMLRGNHETREQQKQHTFEAEVKGKFGSLAGKVFEEFNAVFDVMPLVAVIDESIYCAHGGIPSCVQKVEQIAAAIPCPLTDPDNECPIASEVLWNDPISDHEYKDLLKNNQEVAASAINATKGFLHNTKRGTGSYYSNQALKHFLAANGLSHVIRAHECTPSGFQFHAGGQCVTVFSCSRYCQGNNEAAVALVHDSQIRVIKMDTHSDG